MSTKQNETKSSNQLETYIHPTATVHYKTVIEDGVYIGPGCVIGYPAEHLKYWGKESEFKVVIKSGAKITGNVTIDAGTVNDTVIGENCFIMKGVHIGHDCDIHNDTIISPHAIVGGHVSIHSRCNIGMGAIIHQRQIIPEGCMIGMGAIITKGLKMIKGYIYVGNPAYMLKPNPKYDSV